jgi:hypothetical protein
MMKSFTAIFAAPGLCMLIVGGILLEQRGHTKPEDAEPFHATAKAALENWPVKIGDTWASHETKIPDAAIRLLRPNVTVSRRYQNLKNNRVWADLLIVQCKDPIDMSGHYPPNCYPNNGMPMASQEPRAWTVGEGAEQLRITGKEYQFDGGGLGQPQRQWVYNFFVLPGRGIVPDMTEVRKATGDYQRRYYGCAQFQLVFSTDLGPELRDQIFKEIVGSNAPVLRTLNPKGL